MTDPILVAFWIVYGIGLVLVYGALFRRKLAHFRKHRDRRAYRDAVEGGGYFLVALCGAAGITWAIFGAKGTNVGTILSLMAAAFFLVNGVYQLRETQPENGAIGQARRQ